MKLACLVAFSLLVAGCASPSDPDELLTETSPTTMQFSKLTLGENEGFNLTSSQEIQLPAPDVVCVEACPDGAEIDVLGHLPGFGAYVVSYEVESNSNVAASLEYDNLWVQRHEWPETTAGPSGKIQFIYADSATLLLNLNLVRSPASMVANPTNVGGDTATLTLQVQHLSILAPASVGKITGPEDGFVKINSEAPLKLFDSTGQLLNTSTFLEPFPIPRTGLYLARNEADVTLDATPGVKFSYPKFTTEILASVTPATDAPIDLTGAAKLPVLAYAVASPVSNMDFEPGRAWGGFDLSLLADEVQIANVTDSCVIFVSSPCKLESYSDAQYIILAGLPSPDATTIQLRGDVEYSSGMKFELVVVTVA